jgi:heat shock protein HtpX
VRILDDAAANAVLLAQSSKRAVLVVTSGLLNLLERIELEGVLAHELSHLRRGDAARAAGATRSAGLLASLWAGTPLFVLRLAGREREARADLAAVALTRYPPGLAAALEKLSTVPTRPAGLDAATARLTAPLWCAPLEEGVPNEPLAGALSLPERAALLHEL